MMASVTQRALLLVAACAVASATDISGYSATSPAVTGILAMHDAIIALKTALGSADWTAAETAYTTVGKGASYSIQQLSTTYPASLGGYSATGTSEFANFATYYGNNPKYSDDFVMAAIGATGDFASLAGLSWGNSARNELAIKGAVLQGMWMAVVHTLDTACAAADPQAAVDVAWALYAAGSEAPIGLAEKRAPQFAVERVAGAGPAGSSKVNANLLSKFTALQTALSRETKGSATCTAAVDNALPGIMGQMVVPLIQGTLRETWETSEGSAQADGEVEVAEGWALARAILPLLYRCDTEAAALVWKNLNTLEGARTGKDGRNVPAGFSALKGALESTYFCLGITCADVNAMVHPSTGELLWTPCTTVTGPTSPTHAPTTVSAARPVSPVAVAVLAAVAATFAAAALL